MDIVQAVSLALLQGLTEFLPISSSAHLVLLPMAVDWPDQSLAFDVAVHVGTLLAVIGYFREDLRAIVVDWLASLRARRAVGQSRLGWYVILGTVPVGLAGLAVSHFAPAALRSPLVIAAATVGFALALWWADRRGTLARGTGDLRLGDVMLIGCAQALALVPGASRSGVTITAGMLLGLDRRSAARFSFLLSVPVIALAGLLKTAEAVSADAPAQWLHYGIGVLVAAVTAYATIHFFLVLIDRIGLMPFVWYRLALGAVLFAVYA